MKFLETQELPLQIKLNYKHIYNIIVLKIFFENIKSRLKISLRKQTSISKKAIPFLINNNSNLKYMKYSNLLLLFLFISLFYSCEDVINVDLKNDNPRLVVEASINWLKGTTGEKQQIKLSKTSDYYSNNPTNVLDALVVIKNNANVQFNFKEKPNTGIYICENFVPILDGEYKLTIATEGQIYEATEKLISVAPITKLENTRRTGFDGKTVTQFKAFYTDPPNIDNYYLYNYIYTPTLLPNYNVTEDTFFQGNEIFSTDFKRELKSGDRMQVSHFGISKKYYNYLNILLTIAGNSGGGPFQSPPATVRGNISNTTNVENYPLGFFNLSEQSDSEIYTYP